MPDPHFPPARRGASAAPPISGRRRISAPPATGRAGPSKARPGVLPPTSLSGDGPGEMLWACCAVAVCVLVLALYPLWPGPAGNAAGFLTGAVGAPVAFAAAWSEADLAARWGAGRYAAAAAALAGWSMGAAHCFFLAQHLSR